MEEKNKTKIYNLVILDKSGSMQSIRKEAVDGFNETLGSIKATQLKLLDTQEHYVSLAAFCGCGIDMIYDMTPIKDADRLDMKQYSPCCHTPLYDAIGKTVNAIKKKTAEVEGAAVLVTILTDGFENSSQEWDAKGVASLIDECKEEGWMFSFIGAGEDVVRTASKISITNTMVWENTSEGTEAMFLNENKARNQFCERLDRQVCNLGVMFTKEEKKRLFGSLASKYYDKIK